SCPCVQRGGETARRDRCPWCATPPRRPGTGCVAAKYCLSALSPISAYPHSHGSPDRSRPNWLSAGRKETAPCLLRSPRSDWRPPPLRSRGSSYIERLLLGTHGGGPGSWLAAWRSALPRTPVALAGPATSSDGAPSCAPPKRAPWRAAWTVSGPV